MSRTEKEDSFEDLDKSILGYINKLGWTLAATKPEKRGALLERETRALEKFTNDMIYRIED